MMGRLAIYYLLDDSAFSAFNAGDIIGYGLVLHITMLNTLDNFYIENKKWVTIVNGAAIFGIVIYAILFTFHVMPTTIGNGKILFFSSICILFSVTLGALVQFLLTRQPIQKEKING